MAENQKRILDMLNEKKITVEEAQRLLSLVGFEPGKGDTASGTETGKKNPPKYLRVVVTPGPESGPRPEKVNIRVPVSLIRAGMKLTSLIPSEAADKVHDAMKEKGINFDLRNIKDGDIEALIADLGDLEVNVDSEGQKVHIYVE